MGRRRKSPEQQLQAKMIGQRIRSVRMAKGLSQRALAQAMGLSPNAVCGWEKGRSMPESASLPRLSEVLGEPVAFFTGESMSGRDSMDALSRAIGRTLGVRRLTELVKLPPGSLKRRIDALISEAEDDAKVVPLRGPRTDTAS